MSPLVLIIKELSHRKANAILSLLAVTIAVGGSIVLHTAFEGSLQRTKRIQRDMGQNLRIVSKDTDHTSHNVSSINNNVGWYDCLFFNSFFDEV